jgi:hypothetical protein
VSKTPKKTWQEGGKNAKKIRCVVLHLIISPLTMTPTSPLTMTPQLPYFTPIINRTSPLTITPTSPLTIYHYQPHFTPHHDPHFTLIFTTL